MVTSPLHYAHFHATTLASAATALFPRATALFPDAVALWAASYNAEGRIVEARARSLHATLNYWCLEYADRLMLSVHEVRYEHDNEGRILRRNDSDGRV